MAQDANITINYLGNWINVEVKGEQVQVCGFIPRISSPLLSDLQFWGGGKAETSH